MRIAIIGSRGIPAGYGGFETFAEEIAIRLKAAGMEITVVCQDSIERPSEFKNVRLLYSRYSKARQPVRFYFDSLKIGIKNAEVVVVCGVGGAIFYPFIIRKNVLLYTHVDGREELRGKYSALKKLYVRISQFMTAKYSNHIIADGFAVRNHWIKKYKMAGNKISAIEFGAEIVADPGKLGSLNADLKSGDYYLVVCRMVPENNLEMILAGFIKSGSVRKLILVGDTTDGYGKSLRKYASEQIIFLEGVYDKPLLTSLRVNCHAYIHGHSVGGTNPSLLEAMAAGNICICHDNEFNRETTESKMRYFKSSEELKKCIFEVEKLSIAAQKEFENVARKRIMDYYNWERITREYIKLFNSIAWK